MRTIAYGQLAAEQTVAAMKDKPFIFRDTDLLSTIGFYRLYYEQEPSWLIDMWEQSKADLYIFTQSNIPFAPDILRYGGDKREAPDSFWKSILDDYKVNYYTLENSDHASRTLEVSMLSNKLFMSHPAWSYERKGNT
jgi:nicotinamide riboside kinase